MDSLIEIIMEIFLGPFTNRLENRIKKVPGRLKKIILWITLFIIVIGIYAAFSYLFNFFKSN